MRLALRPLSARFRRGVVGAVLAVLGLACTTTAPTPTTDAPTDAAAAAEAWARVLREQVDDEGRIDFEGLAADPADLERYVAWVADADRLLADPEAHLATLLDVYNALAMWNVVRTGIPESLGDKKADFFALTKFEVGDRELSLRALENDVLRKLGEPRIHFALNCMVRACPRLPREPYSAVDLDAVLDERAREFFSQDLHVELHPDEETVRFSEILRFYTDDFLAAAPSLVAYANRYRDDPIPEGFAVEFIPYDWTVNAQP